MLRQVDGDQGRGDRLRMSFMLPILRAAARMDARAIELDGGFVPVHGVFVLIGARGAL